MLRVASSLVVPPLPSCGLAPCMGLKIGLEATDFKIIVLRFSFKVYIRSIKFASGKIASIVFDTCIVNITPSFEVNENIDLDCCYPSVIIRPLGYSVGLSLFSRQREVESGRVSFS